MAHQGLPGLDTVWVFAAYSAITLVLAFPLVRDLGSSLPSDLGDPVLHTWLLWWNTTGLPFTERWWNAPIFYPSPDTLTYSDHLFGISLLSTPVYWLTANPVSAHNVALLLSFPLSGLSAYLLCLELTGRRDAAWIAGLAFGFAPYRMDHLSHIQVLTAYWIPFGLLSLHRYYRDHQARWLGVFSVAFLMIGLSNGYYLFFYPVLILLWMLWFTPNEGWWRKTAAVSMSGIAAVLVLGPTLLRYQRAHEAVGFNRGQGEILEFSADVSGLLSGSVHSFVWNFPGNLYRAEGQLFPGITVALLAVAALWHVRWRPRGLEPIGLRIVRYAVGIGSLTLALAVIALVSIGPWEITPFGVTISVSRLPNIVAQGMLFWVFSLVLSPAGAWAYRRHSGFAFYLLAAFVLGVLALGPEPKLLGHDFMAHSAYKALTPLPGYEALRVPARFWMLTTICLSTVAGLAFARLVPATSRRRPLALAFVTVGVLADGWVLFPTVSAPTGSPALDLASGTVLELPLGTRDQDAAAMLRSGYHGQALVNGYSGYPPRHYRALAYGLESGNDDVLDLLSRYGVRFVRIDRSHTAAPRYERYVAAQPGARLVRKDPTEMLYELTRTRTVPASPALGKPVTIVGVSANIAGNTVERAIDGSRLSRWETGPQRPGHAISVELATAQPLGAVTMQLGPFASDFPRELTVELSADGRWQEVWSGPTDVLALAGALREPLDIPMVIPLGGRVANRVRLRSTSSDPEFSWSIAEVSVLGPASSSSE